LLRNRLQSRAESESLLVAVHPGRAGATAQRSALIERSRAPKASRPKSLLAFFFSRWLSKEIPSPAVDVPFVCGPFMVSGAGAVFGSVEAQDARAVRAGARVAAVEFFYPTSLGSFETPSVHLDTKAIQDRLYDMGGLRRRLLLELVLHEAHHLV